MACVERDFTGGYPAFDELLVGDKTLPYWGQVRAFGYGNPEDTLGSFEFGVTNVPTATWTDRDPFVIYTNHDVDISKGSLLENIQTKVPPFSYADPLHAGAHTHTFVTLDCILTMR